MTLDGAMALAIVRAILAHPEKFSRELNENAIAFDEYWRDMGEEYWSRPDPASRFPKDCIPWHTIHHRLPEDFSERLKSLDSPESL